MSAQTERDETQAAIDLLVARLDRIRRDIRREGEGADSRSIGLFKGDVTEVLAELEQHLSDTAAALATANTGYAVSRAYLTVGKVISAPAGQTGTIIPLDQVRRTHHARRQGSR